MAIINAIILIVMLMGLVPLFSGVGMLLNGRGTAISRDGGYQVTGTKSRVLGAGHILMGVLSVFPGITGLLGLIDTQQVSIWLYTAGPFLILIVSWLIADRLPGTAVKQEIPKTSG